MKKNNGNFLSGILGALLGAIVGAIPAALLYLFADMFLGYAFLLIGIASAFGYRLFKGKKIFGIAFTVCLIFSIIVPLAYLAFYIISLFAEQDIPAYLAMAVLSDPLNAEIKSAILSDAGLTLVFSVIGVIAAWKPLKVYCADDGVDVDTSAANNVPTQVETAPAAEETVEETPVVEEVTEEVVDVAPAVEEVAEEAVATVAE